MRALSVCFLLLLVGQNTLLFGQENDDPRTDLPRDTIQVVDTLMTTVNQGDFSSVELSTTTKDSVVFALKDDPMASRMDSLWLSELANNDLYQELYTTVTDLDYEPVEYEELPTEVLKERLEAIDAKTPFNVEYNPQLESVIKYYLKNRRRSMGRLMARANYYFPMFEEALNRHEIPLELKYLAIVESALDPTAKSRVGATGLWQFMFTTGKIYDLDVSSYVDERSDPLMATEAACKYLKTLYNSFEDWDLALAAYNSGPGNVSKAIRRSGGYTNYWNIRGNLPRETAGYLPSFLATMYLFEYAEEHGFKPTEESTSYIATDTVKVKQLITLEQVSRYTNVPVEQLQFLNPSYFLGIIPVVKDEDYVLRLPIQAIGPFVANEDAIYGLATEEIAQREKPLPEFVAQDAKIRYRVRSGDYLGKIANKYGVRVSQIRRWNNLRSDNLRVGQRLTIYPRNPGRARTTSAATTTTNSQGAKVYTVKQGDSLWSIAQKFPGVSVENIKSWNDISGTALKPGMKLKVSKG
ncbi:LysM peptidoglycan-binding domain-containing protein [Gilvibacter sp.]|uniref:LysM peptidoglycan-binding domain-containing protein n=1 Tax=Gilvibacter sp. TaxID=2729997 RepID=UPI0025C385EA|nr:LysM peptidoglycan-binding domain-containing protein [Gilvibacter sp.]NQX78490.1 LysM peptidoglycan-binding domain-containing protein [Gilvibacter sp.]